MKNLTPAEATRLGVYILGALVGAIFAVYGMIHSDGGLIATGLTALGLGGTAAKNVPATAGDDVPDVDVELEDLEDEPKHAAS